MFVEQLDLCGPVLLETLILEGEEVEFFLGLAEGEGGVEELPLLVLVLALNAVSRWAYCS